MDGFDSATYAKRGYNMAKEIQIQHTIECKQDLHKFVVSSVSEHWCIYEVTINCAYMIKHVMGAEVKRT